MKNFVKWSLIIGFIICLLGVGMITGGAMMGGTQGFVSYMRNYDYTIGWHDDGYERGLIIESGGEKHSYDAAGDQEFNLDGIRKLDLKVGVGKLEIRQEARSDKDDTSLRVVSEDTKIYYTIYQEEDTLKVEPVKSMRIKDRAWDRIDSLITIYVPEDYWFREVKLDAKAGEINADALYAEELDLEVSAGSIVIDEGQVGKLEAECSAGSITCMAEAQRSAEADCDAGEVLLVMAEGKDQYDYELECAAGIIQLGGEDEEKYSGLKQKQRIDHGTGRKVELECTAGKITVQFPESV